MSTKFEQLLDYLVNEEMDKANELFHEIVVEKSRDIYESLIAEEAEEDEEMDEGVEDEESDEEEMDEGVEELEDSYSMEADDDSTAFRGDGTDDFEDEITANDDGMDDEMDSDEFDSTGGDDQAVFDIKSAIEELEAALEKLNAGGDTDADADADFGDEEFGDEEGDEEFGDEEGDEEDDQMMGMYEGRRMTREYREKVGNDWEKNSQKTQGQIVGANTGEKMPGSNEGKSPISSGKGKPTTGANANNILGKSATAAEDGTKPHGKVGGLVKGGGKFTSSSTHNVDNVKSGVKTLSKVSGGHGAEKKGAAPGPVGSGSGDKAGQTSIAPETKKQFLPQHTK
jgi:hypothetical protein